MSSPGGARQYNAGLLQKHRRVVGYNQHDRSVWVLGTLPGLILS